MFNTLVQATLVFVFASQALAEFNMVTPAELVQCQPAKLTWDHTSPPYNMAVVPGNDPCGDVLLDLGDHDGDSMTWVANLPAGTIVMFSLLDATDNDAWTGALTIQGSNDTSCLPGASSSAAAPGSTAGANGTGARATPAAPTTSTTATQGDATAVGAANAGLDVPGLSGAPASVHISTFGTVLGAVVAIAAAAVL